MTEPSREGRGITRRGFVMGAAGVVVTGTAAAYMGRPLLREWVRPIYDGRRPALDTAAPTGELSEAELPAILALVEVLVPPRYHPGPSRVHSIIQTATSQEPGVLAEYAMAARYLDGLAADDGGRRFHELSPAERDALLARIFWEYPAGPRGNRRNYFLARAEPLLIGQAAGRLRVLVVRDLVRRLYMEARPILVGYANLPGVPGDPREYVTATASSTQER